MLLNASRIRRWTIVTDRSELILLSALTLGHLVVHWHTSLLSLALPFIKDHFDLSDIQVGTIVTVQMGVATTAIIISGFLADTFRSRGAVIVSAAVASFGIALFLIGVSPSFGWILLGSGMVGLGTALWHPAAMGALSLRFHEHRGAVLAVHGMGASIGDAVGPIIIGAVILVADWKLTLGLHVIPAIVISLLLWRSLGMMGEIGSPRTTLRNYVVGIKQICLNLQAVVVIVSNALIHMSRLSVLAFFPIYIKETLGYSAFILGIYLALLYVTGIVSLPAMGLLSDRFGRKAVLVPSFLSMGILCIGIVVMPSGVPLGITVGILGMFFYASANMAQIAIMDVAPEQVQSSTMGIMSLFSLPFSMISPVLVGYLVTEIGITSAFWYAAVAALLAGAILIPVQFRRTI